MKYLFLLLISSNVFAQKDTIISLPIQDGKIFYEHVYQDSGMTKNNLFIKSKDVFLRLFPDTKDVIQNEDKDNGIISGKGNFDMSFDVIKFTIRILVKDNKYKVQMFDFYSDREILGVPMESTLEAVYNRDRNRKHTKAICHYYENFNNRVLYIFSEVESQMNKKLSTDF